MRASRPSLVYCHSQRSADGFFRRVCPAGAQPSPAAAPQRRIARILTSLQTIPFSTLVAPRHPSLSARLQLRSRSSIFTPIDPDAITVPASLVERINNSTEADDDMDDDESAEDDDPTTLIERSTAARRTLFRTLLQLHRMDAAGLSMEYVDAIISSITAYQPLLPREQVHIAALYAHVGRETDAVVWIGRLLRDGQMTAEWAELVRDSAERAGLVGLEERMNRIVQTFKSGTPAPLTVTDETAATAKV